MKQAKNDMIISMKDIFVEFDGEVILNHIDLDIKDKEFVTILGPSGCGKTTTLRIIGGFLEPDQGEVYFEGEKINGIPPHKRNVNTVFQKYSLFPHLNVFENVAFGMRIKKMPKDEIKKRVTEMLAIVDLKGYEKRSISKLSGGQQQRVAIARALVCDPKVLLLDEPLGALDLKLRKNMQWELKQIQQKTNTTFIYVTHDQEEALTMSDTIVVMNNGIIEQIGSPTDIYNEPVNAFVADFIGEANIINGTMIDDCRVRVLGVELECVDKGFGKNTPVDIVIRPEDIELVKPEEARLVGEVTDVVFKGVHYEMTVLCNGCEWLVHSTECTNVGEKVGMKVIPFNIQIMNKLFATENNSFVAEVISADEDERTITIQLEDSEIDIENQFFPEGSRIKVTLPPTALSIAGDGIGHLDDCFIESVIFKGEHNEIILESDNQKWLMQSAQDEQVATYVPLKFDFTKATFEVMEGENEIS